MSEGANGPITIAAVGDFMFFDRPDPADIETVKPLLAGADLVIGNVDVVLANGGTPVPKWANLRADPAIAHDLRELGITVSTLANNHTMDYRADAMHECLDAYDAAGILRPGAGRNLAEAAAPAIVETPNGSVAVLSVCSTLSPEAAARPEAPGVAPLRIWQAFKIDEPLLAEQPGSVPEVRTWPDAADLERVRNDIAAARQQADHVLVVIHWGVPTPWRAPFHPVLQEYQRTVGHALVEAGAGAVIGNHAHELHGFELYRNTPIIYCLGNFWIDGLDRFPWMSRESIVLRLRLDPDGAVALEVVPLYLDDRGVPRLDTAARAISVLTDQSRELGVTIRSDDKGYVVSPN